MEGEVEDEVWMIYLYSDVELDICVLSLDNFLSWLTVRSSCLVS